MPRIVDSPTCIGGRARQGWGSCGPRGGAMASTSGRRESQTIIRGVTGRFRVPQVLDRFCGPARRRLRCGGGLPRRRPWSVWSTVNAIAPHASSDTRAYGGGEVNRHASPDDDLLPACRRREASQTVLAPIFEDQVDGASKTLQRRRLRLPLAIRSGNLWAVRDVPVPVPFHHRSEFVSHASSCTTSYRPPGRFPAFRPARCFVLLPLRQARRRFERLFQRLRRGRASLWMVATGVIPRQRTGLWTPPALRTRAPALARHPPLKAKGPARSRSPCPCCHARRAQTR